MVHVTLQPCLGVPFPATTPALRFHDLNTVSSILMKLCEKFSDTKLKSASTRFSSYLDGYSIKSSRVCKAGTWFSGKRTSPDSTTNVTCDTVWTLLSLILFPLSTMKLLDLKVSKSFTILGFVYRRLNHIKLLCLWAKSSQISAGEYFTSYKPQARTFHCLVWFLFKKSPCRVSKRPYWSICFHV